MTEADIPVHLEQNDIKPTANRILVIRELMTASTALSLGDLEARLGTVDKSSIFRVLSLLSEHHLIHQINDSTGQTKYALCEDGSHSSDPHHNISDEHIHFHCERCKRTFCLPSEHIPDIKLPEGFHIHNAEMVVTGLCPECIKKYGCKL